MRSSTSAKAGRFLSLSIRGAGPFIPEILKRRGSPGLAVHLYEAPDGCALDDRDAWQAANPGLGTIKALDYMTGEAERVRITPADQASFRAFDLNQRLDPSRELLCQIDDWRAVEVDDLPPRRGPAVLGFDLGGSASMTAAVAIWPSSGRMETWAAFPAEPDLQKRGERDGVGSLYGQMVDRGELRTYPGRVTPCAAFLGDVAARLDGVRVLAAGADRYRQSEALDALDAAGVRWPLVWRGTGAAPGAHGSADVRALQRAVLARRIKVRPSLLLRHAIGESSIRTDGAGNPALDKKNSASRIDVLQAAVIAAGLAERQRQPSRPARMHVA